MGQIDIAKDDRITLDGELVTVVAVTATTDGFECIVKSPTRGLVEAFLRRSQLAEVMVTSHDGGGNSSRAITAVWATWMAWSVPRIRSAVLATRPLRPYAHQDDAVFALMLPQPRLRFLLADEPGTGKTLMTGMYLAEGRRRGLIPGKTIIATMATPIEQAPPRVRAAAAAHAAYRKRYRAEAAALLERYRTGSPGIAIGVEELVALLGLDQDPQLG